MANLAAESYAAIGNKEKSKEKFQLVLAIINRIKEQNVWTMASKVNANIAIGNMDAAEKELDKFKVGDSQLSVDEHEIILNGLKRVADYFDVSQSISGLINKLEGM